MNDVIELNSDEIKYLANIDDVSGHTWAMYTLLKKNINIYTGIVQVEAAVLAKVFLEKLNIDIKSDSKNNSNSSKYIDYIYSIIQLLINSNIISIYIPKQNNDLLYIKLPYAISETCLDLEGEH